MKHIYHHKGGSGDMVVQSVQWVVFIYFIFKEGEKKSQILKTIAFFIILISGVSFIRCPQGAQSRGTDFLEQ